MAFCLSNQVSACSINFKSCKKRPITPLGCNPKSNRSRSTKRRRHHLNPSDTSSNQSLVGDCATSLISGKTVESSISLSIGNYSYSTQAGDEFATKTILNLSAIYRDKTSPCASGKTRHRSSFLRHSTPRVQSMNIGRKIASVKTQGLCARRLNYRLLNDKSEFRKDVSKATSSRCGRQFSFVGETTDEGTRIEHLGIPRTSSAFSLIAAPLFAPDLTAIIDGHEGKDATPRNDLPHSTNTPPNTAIKDNESNTTYRDGQWRFTEGRCNTPKRLSRSTGTSAITTASLQTKRCTRQMKLSSVKIKKSGLQGFDLLAVL